MRPISIHQFSNFLSLFLSQKRNRKKKNQQQLQPHRPATSAALESREHYDHSQQRNLHRRNNSRLHSAQTHLLNHRRNPAVILRESCHASKAPPNREPLIPCLQTPRPAFFYPTRKLHWQHPSMRSPTVAIKVSSSGVGEDGSRAMLL
ncbi:unnamed protein product [Vicia faba]|uniref:Uncharacterized protein n=1 Tax=Vicia faba TaxID=3906 RepID=A0AAV1A0D0_VICFA|nr:unnamed protein product [Vicia faba]